MIGTLRGPLFVETDQGPVRAGELLCPATVTVDLESLRQVGAGRCTFTAKDGALAFGSFVCAGYHLVGCTGDFVLDGGTERLEGVTGSGPITIRGDGWLIATDGSGEAAESAVGITVLPDFRLTAKP